ncbi:MAG: GTP cyclohydrolase I [Candidatus Gottesmanbacteria bacterium]
MKANVDTIAKGVSLILTGLGIDWKHDKNFIDTPKRVARTMAELNNGLYSPYERFTSFPSSYNGIIFFKSIKATALCPHHLMPIEYDISFAYIPNGSVLGLSKIPRIIKNLCQRPVLQEDLTNDIVKKFAEKLQPKGIAIEVRGIHGCMKYRGIEEADIVKTAQLYGLFLTAPQTREEFYNLIAK